jgi:signal transduction histidine kinase
MALRLSLKVGLKRCTGMYGTSHYRRAPRRVQLLYDPGNFHRTIPMSEAPTNEQERKLAARVAELTELLGHLANCWDDERRQLARQLHDNLGSSMTALTMHLGLLAQQLPAEGKARDRAGQMKNLLTNIIETNRTMQLALWNDKLEFLGIKAALNELASQSVGGQGPVVRASLPDDDVQCSREQGVVLLRCAEEGLRNVRAHAQASEAELVLDDDGEQLMLTVRDNGIGPAGSVGDSQNCHGLRVLRERARILGGTLELSAHPDGGTALTLVLPRVAV